MSNAECRVPNEAAAEVQPGTIVAPQFDREPTPAPDPLQVVRIEAYDVADRLVSRAFLLDSGWHVCRVNDYLRAVGHDQNAAIDALTAIPGVIRTVHLTRAEVENGEPGLPIQSQIGNRQSAIDLASLRMLTVYQPWASLLVHGVKQIETRSRRYTHTGLLFIHAGLMWDDDTRRAAYSFASHFRSIGLDINVPAWAEALPKGAIIGAVRMVGCKSTEDLIEECKVSDDERRLGNYGVDRFGWLMEDAVPFKNPIFCRGGQGPRFIPRDLAQAVIDELHNSTNDIHVARLMAAPVS